MTLFQLIGLTSLLKAVWLKIVSAESKIYFSLHQPTSPWSLDNHIIIHSTRWMLLSLWIYRQRGPNLVFIISVFITGSTTWWLEHSSQIQAMFGNTISIYIICNLYVDHDASLPLRIGQFYPHFAYLHRCLFFICSGHRCGLWVPSFIFRYSVLYGTDSSLLQLEAVLCFSLWKLLSPACASSSRDVNWKSI